MSRHEGVSCDSCLKSNFNGRRYKCLICYDYDLCADCYEDGVTSTRHLVDHPMQCILTRSDIELFFGGEMLNSEQPQSFTCPYCKKMGFSDATLLEHVSAEHTETSLEVVCPVCAGLPGGEPNLVTDDFAGHLTLEHRTGPRELISFLDEPSAIRHGGGVRRIPGRTLGGPRARRSNMHFSSSSGLSALSPSGRESVDPIAELLSQLSGVRRGGPQTSQLQQLQMQIQLERQQVTATRQQLERLPRRAHPMVSSSNSNATMPEVISSGPILSGSGSGGSGASGSGSLNGGGGSSCRTNEWTVNPSLAAQQQSQSGLTGSGGINSRETGGGSGSVNGGSGSNASNILGMTIAGGAVGAGVNSASNGADVQSQFLLTKFMQPTLSDTEWAEMERERSDRSQFVQALVLSTLSYDSLETIAIGDGETERDNRGESQETNSDNVNNEKVSAANTKSDANARESLMNNNTDASAQTTNTSGGGSSGTMPGSGRQQVHQQQQTSPEDIADEYKQLQQQQQAQQQTYASKKKSTSNTGVSGGAGGTAGKPTADRGIERRGRPPPPPIGGGAAAAGSQPQQQHSR
ncbi:E3 ubiquitin-protein ligase Kcmf1 [Zeugodacus cucurbitae]|uniref:RING-type E3 ubiquitin transferase n=1 Tax=Zeugodacus cucurbitae TaxID=28588 RepID=A0A0A1XNA6_ZEUCU|nr:E3 ubiquitin-protein ligase Kcmf1 [Zeugodacus cucurbitae]XP_011184096.1 E3 ubiquitin-protein ligase Kcmf1 [Zeugodacus cucurbitae]XP_011184099.1 E3 ubiquitin-protein ligase Kcmf1 [Zeugodacus cucurbitae]XP_028896704.1 E3 ubiquitin-protein ligase Kcmf1 [Zeugodacus cucurbitae]XP_028896705.1 E3 ubiquitin-protein ligase Kcmf1 [Zeugodacus cucurbitae]XP_054081267.1 E3 ubiquitin-protein ligase Kcmf1 [Zeugodacus cucurbitae]